MAILAVLVAAGLVTAAWYATRPATGADPLAGGGGSTASSGGLGLASVPAGTGGSAASGGASAGVAGSTSAAGSTGTGSPNASPGATPRTVTGSGGNAASPAPTSGAASTTPGVAPTSAVGFKPRDTIVPMLFPLRSSASYQYGDAWRVPRLGIVYPYNQIHGVGPGGVLLRAHDGVDIQVKVGTPVLAPFAGVVIDPKATWKPWDPTRYGNVVAIRSTEASSRGYETILVHLSVQNVKVGQAVKRGQVVGKTGITGNAEGTIPHLHFELRTPFQVEFHYAGVTRLLDSFDPMPSLLAADPKH